MLRYLIVLGTALAVLPSYLIGQQSEIDSLNTLLKNAKDDTTRAQVYIELTELYARTNLDTVIPLCEKVIAISDAGLENDDPAVQLAFHRVKVSAYNNIGYVYSMKEEVLTALE